jgi:hypothetical protein
VKGTADGQALAIRRCDRSTGDAALAEAATASDFMDRALPPWRLQGDVSRVAENWREGDLTFLRQFGSTLK